MNANVQLGHVNLLVQDPREAARFYRELLGLEQILEGSIDALGDFVFLARRADDPLPLIALSTRPEARHCALEVESLDALRHVLAAARASGRQPSFALDHQCSVSLYFHDPDGNAVEVFWATGRAADDPTPRPFDPDELDRPASDLLERYAAVQPG
jgi:catechol 2,3-dioxygenase